MRGRITAALTACALMLAAACSSGDATKPVVWKHKCPSKTSGALAIVVGGRGSVPAPSLTGDPVALVLGAAKAKQTVSVVRVDGEPTIEFSTKFVSDAGNEGAYEEDLRRFVLGVVARISAVRAKKPEADLLGALSLAGRKVGPGGTVVVLDSGLQTVPPLDFRAKGMLDAEPSAVVSALQGSGSLPVLKDRSVVLAGIGDVAPPQPRPDEATRKRLVSIWTSIARSSGACVEPLDNPRTVAAARGVPHVSTVPMPVVETPEFTPVPAEEQKKPTPRCVQTALRDSGKVAFLPDEAEFADREAVRTQLQKLLPRLKNGPIELLGATSSWGTEQGRLRLSEQRAIAVKKELVALGVPAARIKTKGVGTHWPGYIKDRSPFGDLLLGPAAANRKVVIRVGCAPT